MINLYLFFRAGDLMLPGALVCVLPARTLFSCDVRLSPMEHCSMVVLRRRGTV